MTSALDGADPGSESGAGTPMPSGSDAGPDSDGSQFMISQTASWIVNADTKAGLLLTAVAVLGAALAGQISSTLKRSTELDIRLGSALVLFAAAAVVLGISVFHIYRVLIPRTGPTASESRFSWPWLSQRSPQDLLGRNPGGLRLEAWAQAVTLAAIASAKFSAFRTALRFAIIGGVFLLAGSVVGF